MTRNLTFLIGYFGEDPLHDWSTIIHVDLFSFSTMCAATSLCEAGIGRTPDNTVVDDCLISRPRYPGLAYLA